VFTGLGVVFTLCLLGVVKFSARAPELLATGEELHQLSAIGAGSAQPGDGFHHVGDQQIPHVEAAHEKAHVLPATSLAQQLLTLHHHTGSVRSEAGDVGKTDLGSGLLRGAPQSPPPLGRAQ